MHTVVRPRHRQLRRGRPHPLVVHLTSPRRRAFRPVPSYAGCSVSPLEAQAGVVYQLFFRCLRSMAQLVSLTSLAFPHAVDRQAQARQVLAPQHRVAPGASVSQRCRASTSPPRWSRDGTSERRRGEFRPDAAGLDSGRTDRVQEPTGAAATLSAGMRRDTGQLLDASPRPRGRWGRSGGTLTTTSHTRA
jgi:hypothetical protein